MLLTLLLLPGLLAILGITILSILGIVIGRMIIMPKTRSAEEVVGADILAGHIDPSLIRLPWEPFETEGGTEGGKPVLLRGMSLRGAGGGTEAGAAHTIIFCHGYSGNRYSSFRFLGPFLQARWNILLWDMRGHGSSGGNYVTFGAGESEDLKAIHSLAVRTWPGSRVHLYGVSMGGATVLRYLARFASAASVERAVSDCSFESLRTILLERRFRGAGIPLPLGKLLYPFLRRHVKLRAGFDPDDIRPDRDSLETGIPLLFIHGEEDRETPVSVAHAFFKARKERASTELLTIPGADHTRSATTDPVRWGKVIQDFFTITQHTTTQHATR